MERADKDIVYRLFIIRPLDKDNQEIRIEDLCSGTHVLGRSGDCTIRIEDPQSFISRRHCYITIKEDKSISITDLGGKNGTSITDSMGRKQILNPHIPHEITSTHKIHITHFSLRFENPLANEENPTTQVGEFE